jgi:cellulose biosynthesis protein BcsQ
VKEQPRLISFVSGKGGVGKTSLAVNFAWLCSQVYKTVLIDLDFQNQGATGMMIRKLPSDTCGVFEVLHGACDAKINPGQIDKNLYFVPAISLLNPPNYGVIADTLRSPSLKENLSEYLESLVEQSEFKIVVLDCHGGLDYSSVAAHKLSNDTLVVTEADVVAFNGTLELLEFYEYHDEGVVPPPPEADGQEDALPAEDVRGEISLIVNRLPPRYRYSDINRTYTRLLTGYKGELKVKPEVASFIPDESFFSETFGDYPFSTQLAPKSVLARKTQLLMVEMLGLKDEQLKKYKPLRKLRSPRFRKKIKTTTLSAESKNIRNVLYAFGWLVTAISVGILAFIVWAIYDTIRTDAIQRQTAALTGPVKIQSAPHDYTVVIAVVVVVALALTVFYSLRAMVGMIFYYNDRYKFQRAIVHVLGKPITVWQRLALFKLWTLRWGTLVSPIVIGLFLGLYLIVIIVMMFQGKG